MTCIWLNHFTRTEASYGTEAIGSGIVSSWNVSPEHFIAFISRSSGKFVPTGIATDTCLKYVYYALHAIGYLTHHFIVQNCYTAIRLYVLNCSNIRIEGSIYQNLPNKRIEIHYVPRWRLSCWKVQRDIEGCINIPACTRKKEKRTEFE